MPTPDPEYVIRLPRSAAMVALTAIAKGPLEQVLDAYTLLHAQIVQNEERVRTEERDAIVQAALKGLAHGPDGLR